jgi:predicted nucleic acid-binding protein
MHTLEPADSAHDVAVVLIDEFIKTGRNSVVISMVTVMEVLVKPLRVSPLPVAQEAASFRATHNFTVPDALITATGIVTQVGQLLSNDHKWTTKLASIAGRVRVSELATFV